MDITVKIQAQGLFQCHRMCRVNIKPTRKYETAVYIIIKLVAETEDTSVALHSFNMAELRLLPIL
jgi:hypothetical protein